MTTLTVASSKWNGGLPNEQSRRTVDPRASVGTWTSTRYTPSVLTFNANWAPGPLHFSSASSSRASQAPWSPGGSRGWEGSFLEAGGAAPAGPETSDDGERVSHLDFGSDNEDDGAENKNEGQKGDNGRRVKRLEVAEDYDYDQDADEDEDEYSPDPTPTQERAKFISGRRPSDPFADFNGPLRAYLAGYGFPDGLGYERPPFHSSHRSSSSPSRYSFYEDGNSDEDYNNHVDYAGNSKFAYAFSTNYPRRSDPNAQAQVFPDPSSELPSGTSSAWPTSLQASTALLSSLALDSSLLDDPSRAWEALCWDEAAPESDSDDGNDEESEQNDLQENGVVDKATGDEWSSERSSPYPVFRRHDLAELETDIETDNDARTVSNDTWTENDNETVAGHRKGTSTGTSTITAESSEEWISLTGARAQAARARILPYRHIQVPFPTYPQADISVLTASEDVTRATRATPVDPVLAGTPPVAPSATDHDAGASNSIANTEMMPGVQDQEGMADMLATADSEAVADGETAPHYGECGRDRLLTLTERDPPPYDLAFESTRNSVYSPGTGTGSGEDQGDIAQLEGAVEDPQPGANVEAPTADSQTTAPLAFQKPHQQMLAYAPEPRARSQLTFPTSPTDSDTIPTNSPFSASPISPTDTETTLTTPAGTYFSTLFPHPTPRTLRDSTSVPPHSAKAHSNFTQEGISVNSPHNPRDQGSHDRPPSPPCPFREGGCVESFSSQPQPQPPTNGRSRPLPPRPVGLGQSTGPRTTAEAWFGASAAGPYASGIRTVSGSGSGLPSSGMRFGSWSAFGYGSGLTSGLDGSPESPSGRNLGWRSAASDSGFRSRFGANRETASIEREVVGFPTRSQTQPPAIMHHPNLASTPALSSDESHSAESLNTRLNDNKPKQSLESYKSSSETTFHIIPNSIKLEADAIGLQPAPQKPNNGRSRNRSTSGNAAARPLQRLATRYSTLTRRIGIVAGRER